MQCSINSIILTISLVLKLLSFCGFRALFLLLLQIKFPQWFVSFERQKKVCRLQNVYMRVFTCTYVQAYFCICACMHVCIIYACTYVHTSFCACMCMLYLCACTRWHSGLISACVEYVCLRTFVHWCMFAGLLIFVCVWPRESDWKWSDRYLQHAWSFIISSLFKHDLISFVCLETKYALFYLKGQLFTLKTNPPCFKIFLDTTLSEVRSPTVHCCSPLH